MKKIISFLSLGLLMTSCLLGGNTNQNTSEHSSVDIKNDTREFVDLGLPSGIKWATCNIGASKPEMGGCYFAFGEVVPRTEFEKDKYFVNKDDWGKEKDDLLPFIDDSLEIGVSGNEKYDAARANWGDSWRLPTLKDFRELMYHCEPQWIIKNGVSGCEFTSKETGKSIFLPSVKCKKGSDAWTISADNDICQYMSGTIESYITGVIFMCTEISDEGQKKEVFCSPTSGSRVFGFVVRPVMAPDSIPYPNNKR